jgi:hypothetical protein
MLLQEAQRFPVEPHRAGDAVFRLTDHRLALVKLNVAPGKPEQFSGPSGRCQRQHDQYAKLRVPGCLREIERASSVRKRTRPSLSGSLLTPSNGSALVQCHSFRRR